MLEFISGLSDPEAGVFCILSLPYTRTRLGIRKPTLVDVGGVKTTGVIKGVGVIEGLIAAVADINIKA